MRLAVMVVLALCVLSCVGPALADGPADTTTTSTSVTPTSSSSSSTFISDPNGCRPNCG